MSQIIEALNWRYATKAFDANKKISDADWATIKEAIRLSPSSFGTQPWKFIEVESQEIREKLSQAAEFNRPKIQGASNLIIIASAQPFTKENLDAYVADVGKTRNLPQEALDGFAQMAAGAILSKSADELSIWTQKQCYIPIGVAITTAALLKIDTCAMEGFDGAAFDKILGLDGYKSAAIIAFGYRSSEDPMQHLAKVRFAEEEVFIKL